MRQQSWHTADYELNAQVSQTFTPLFHSDNSKYPTYVRRFRFYVFFQRPSLKN